MAGSEWREVGALPWVLRSPLEAKGGAVAWAIFMRFRFTIHARSVNMTFQNKSACDFLDAIEQWLWDNNHTSADSRIPVAKLLAVPAIQRLQSMPFFSVPALLQQHPRRFQVGDAHTKNPWIYAVVQAQLRQSQAPLVPTAHRTYLAHRLRPEDDAPSYRTCGSIILFTPSATPGAISVLMAQSKNGKFGFIGAKGQPSEQSLLETAQRGFDEATGGVLQVNGKLMKEMSQAARGAQGRVIWNRDAALFFVPLACLPGDAARPEFLPMQHQLMLQNPLVDPSFKKRSALQWCDISWNEASQSLTSSIHQLADWTVQDLECEPFKDWFKENAPPTGGATRARPQVTHAPLVRDYLSGAKGIFQSIPGFCKRKPIDERLQACDNLFQRLSSLLTAVLSECSAVGREDRADLDSLFATVSEATLLLQVIADELPPSAERRAFNRRCNDLAELCEASAKRAQQPEAHPEAAKPAIDVPTPQTLHPAPVTPVQEALSHTFASGFQQHRWTSKQAAALQMPADLEGLLASGKPFKFTFDGSKTKAPGSSAWVGASAQGVPTHFACKRAGCLTAAVQGGLCRFHHATHGG